MSYIINGQDMVLGTCYYPEHWSESLWESDLRRMLEVGIKVVRIAEFAWNKIEPREGEYTFDFYNSFLDLAEKMGMKVIFCTPTATPPAWLTDKYPEVLNASIEGDLYNHGARRHYNYNSPIYQEFCRIIVEKSASHYASHPCVIGWQIDNEINCEMGHFYSESDNLAFRKFLKERYLTLDALNHAWGTVFWNQTYSSWGEVYIPRKTVNNTQNPHHTLDYIRFVSHSACNFTKLQADIIRKYIKTGDFITTNGLFGNLDNHDLTKTSLDFMTYDSYPNFAYLVDSYNKDNKMNDRGWSRSLAEVRSISPNFGIMEQQSGANGWSSWMGAPTPRPGQITLWTMQSVAHGADFISYFRWRTCTVGTEIYWHGILDYSGRDNRRLEEVKRIGHKMEQINEVAGSFYEAEIGVIKDYDNIWDSEVDAWHRRIEHTSQNAIFDAAQFTHTPMDFVFLTKDCTIENLTKYKVLFYPHGVILTEDRVALLEEYVTLGGTLIMGCRTGYKDISGKCVMDYLPGLARKLTGTDVYEYSLTAPDEEAVYVDWEGEKIEAAVFNDLLKPVDSGQIVGNYMNSYYKGAAGLIKNQLGKGDVYYFGGAFTVETVKSFLKKLDVCSPYKDIIQVPETCEVAVRRKGEDRYLFVLNYSREKADIRLFKEMVNLYNGITVSKELQLDGYETVVLKL